MDLQTRKISFVKEFLKIQSYWTDFSKGELR